MLTIQSFKFILSAFFLLCFSAGYAQENLERSTDSTYVDSLLLNSKQLQSQSSFDSTLILANRADSLSKQIGYEKGMVNAAILIADTYVDRQELDNALAVVNHAIQDFPETIRIGELYRIKGVVLHNKGDIIQALPVLQQAAEKSYLLPDSTRGRFLAKTHQDLANTYGSFGNMNESFSNYLKAIDYAESASDSALMTVLYNSLGVSYLHIEEFEKSLYYLDRSLAFARMIKSPIDEYRAHLNMANTLRSMGEYQASLDNYEIAEQFWRELRPNAPPAIIVHNQGKTLLEMDRYQEAEELLMTSLKMSEEIRLPQGMYFNHFELSRLYLELGRNEEAVFHSEQALSLAEGSGSSITLMIAQELMHKVYFEANRYENAYEALRANKILTDSLTNLEKEKELAQLENKLELNRQQQVNELLREKQEQQEKRLRTQYILIVAGILIIILIIALLFISRKTANEKELLLQEIRTRKEELEDLNNAKDRVFAVVSHDLRSPLTSVLGVLELVKDDILKGEEMKRLMDDVSLSVKENVDVIEDLLTWAKEQLSGFNLDLKEVALEPLIKDIIRSQSFSAIRKNVTLESNIRDVVIIGDANALRIIFRNLISNAIKYTETGDKIHIESQDEGDSVLIMVKDNGIGIPKKSVQKIFNSKTWSRQGTQNEKGSGFGLSVTKEFTEKMGGKIWFESEEGEWTTFYVELPKG